MRIGILTFHSQLNYGGVLQCWALQTALEKMGHEVVIIDRWLTPDNWPLERGYDRKRMKWWFRFWFRFLLGLADIRFWLRVRRTKRFIHEKLHLTSYHFYDWKDAPRNLGVDMIVVGSDQVWHCGDFGDPRPYLLEGAPDVPAIAYAASFGFPTLPKKLGRFVGKDAELLVEPIFRSGFSRFRSIGCRESEGVEICRALGFAAMHVADPTLLLLRDEWAAMVHCHLPMRQRIPPRKIVCYFLGECITQTLPILKLFAQKHNIHIDVLANDNDSHNDIHPMPKTMQEFRCWASRLVQGFCRVRILIDASPIDFVRQHAHADAIVTDSFHSLAISSIFSKNVRFLRPRTERRMAMFGRIADFAAHADGPLLADDLSSALESLLRGECVTVQKDFWEQNREKSFDFLERNFR